MEDTIDEFRKEFDNLLLITNKTLLKNRSNKLLIKIFLFERQKDISETKVSNIQELNLMIETLTIYSDINKSELKQLVRKNIESTFQPLKIKINFTDKINGVQSGVIATAIFSNDHNVEASTRFFIKSHQDGAITCTSAASKPVNIIELFIYKAFENLRIGPVARFLFDVQDPLREFFVSTQEAGSTVLRLEETVKPNNNPFRLGNYYKVNDAINADIKNEFDSYEPNFFESLKLELTLLDLFTRIFSLSDCATNSSNYGFIERENELSLCIVDFRTTGLVLENVRIFKQFENGNNQFTYTPNSLQWQLIPHESMSKKIARACTLFEKINLTSFEKVMDQSIEDIAMYIKSTQNMQLQEHFKIKYSLLEEYSECTKFNFKTLFNEVTNYSTDKLM